jgi:hypothetical protein
MCLPKEPMKPLGSGVIGKTPQRRAGANLTTGSFVGCHDDFPSSEGAPLATVTRRAEINARARQSARVDAPLKRSRKGRCSRCWTRVLCSRVSSFTVHASRASVPTSGGKRRPFLWAREENWVRDRGPLINLMRRRCGIWSLVSRGQGLEYAAIRVLDLKPRPFRCIAARRGLRRCACRKGDCSKSRWLCFLPACG